jgi:hypothetical protein
MAPMNTAVPLLISLFLNQYVFVYFCLRDSPKYVFDLFICRFSLTRSYSMTSHSAVLWLPTVPLQVPSPLFWSPTSAHVKYYYSSTLIIFIPHVDEARDKVRFLLRG